MRINQSNLDQSLAKDYLLAQGLSDCIKDEEALYDLVFDPMERNNLIHEFRYASIRDGLKKKLSELQHKTKDPILHGEIKIRSNWKVNKKECVKASSRNDNDYVSLGNNNI